MSRSPPRIVLLAALLLTMPVLAGCFGTEAAVNERDATASGGRASAGWAYDGEGVQPAQATLTASFLDEQNAGEVIASFQYMGSSWDVVFDQFAGAADKPFMDGGIEFDLVEHGDSGVADASIPKILALVAAWGTASVQRDGAPVTGTAGDRWSAHLMVSDTTVRDASGKIARADGTTPYDPATPADAKRVEGDRQALLKLVHPHGETAARPAVTFSETRDFAGPESVVGIPIPAEQGARGFAIMLNATAATGPAAAGELSARVIDATGSEVVAPQEAQVLPNNLPSLVLDVPAELINGPLTLEITGSGAFGVVASGTIAFADAPFIVITWDDVTVT